MNQAEPGKKLEQIIAKAKSNDAFKQRLLADATAVLKEEGVEVPEGLVVRVVENEDELDYVTVAGEKTLRELDDVELSGVAGGGSPASDRCNQLGGRWINGVCVKLEGEWKGN
jgi:hypothetical protein